jgi:hypothetical protein
VSGNRNATVIEGGPCYQWLTETGKMPLEANPLKGWISAHNKQCKQELITTVTREFNFPFMTFLSEGIVSQQTKKQLLPTF